MANNNSTSVPSVAKVLSVLDSNGTSHSFSTLYTSDDHEQQTLFVFIRHFFCGVCKDYVAALSDKDGITPDELSATKKRLIIIGCGQPNLIEQYKKDTKCPFPMYVDSTRKLYEAFGMVRTLNMGDKKPDYSRSSLLSTIGKSFVSAVSSGLGMFQGGDIQQIGGEYLIDGQGNIIWSHNMSNTRDHAEIKELRQILGLN